MNGLPFDVGRDGGVVVFIALRDIRQGERLTASYSELVLLQALGAPNELGDRPTPPLQTVRQR